jgi:predicted ATP-grasp superfamily ATP-dependent carboligase
VYVLTDALHKTSIAWSRYGKKLVILHSRENPEEIRARLEFILHEMGSQSAKPIILVVHESYYTCLEPLIEFVGAHFNLVNPLEKLLPLTIKNNQFPLAEQAGFRVMESIVLRNTGDLSQIENKLSFPVIVRPASTLFRGGFDEKAKLYETFESLQTHLHPILTEEGVELIAQEYIPGSDRDVVFFMASCGESGEPRLWLAGHKVRQNPPGMGLMASGQIDSEPDPEFVEKSKKLCRLFGLRGFIGIECKRHAVSGEYVYIETNIRPEAISAIGYIAGVDIVWDTYLAALDKPCGTVRPETLKGSWAHMELEHAAMKTLRKQGDPNWWKVLIPLPRPIAWAFFAWDDPMPFFHSMSGLFWRRIKRLFTKKTR